MSCAPWSVSVQCCMLPCQEVYGTWNAPVGRGPQRVTFEAVQSRPTNKAARVRLETISCCNLYAYSVTLGMLVG
jgi:hypothetical protein